jgi:hypothetical protein
MNLRHERTVFRQLENVRLRPFDLQHHADPVMAGTSITKE